MKVYIEIEVDDRYLKNNSLLPGVIVEQEIKAGRWSWFTKYGILGRLNDDLDKKLANEMIINSDMTSTPKEPKSEVYTNYSNGVIITTKLK